MGFQHQKTGVFACFMNFIDACIGSAFVRTGIVLVLALALGACAYNPKTGQLRLTGPDGVKAGERWFSPDDIVAIYSGDFCPTCGTIGEVHSYRSDLVPVERWSYGVSVGGLWGTGEMNHFFPDANTNSQISNFVATGTFEYSRSVGYDPSRAMEKWLRYGVDVRTPVSGNSSPNFGGEVLQSHIGWMVTPKVGASVQFLEKNGKTSDFIPINHCYWMTGGLSFANVKDRFADFEHSKTAVGWTVGAGIDFNYAKDWTVRLGIEYTDLGTNTISLPGGPVKVDHTDWSVKLGLFKRFETYAPPSRVGQVM